MKCTVAWGLCFMQVKTHCSIRGFYIVLKFWISFFFPLFRSRMFCTQCATPLAVSWGSLSSKEMESKPWWSILTEILNVCVFTCCVHLYVGMCSIISLTQLLQVWVCSVYTEGQSCFERSWHLRWLLYTQNWICKGKTLAIFMYASLEKLKIYFVGILKNWILTINISNVEINFVNKKSDRNLVL